MKTTRSCKITTITIEQRERLLDLIRTFESAKRYSFNRLTEGHHDKELIKKLQHVYSLNKRYCEDAVLQAQTIISSQKELLPVYLENNQKKLEQTLQKIEEYESGRKRPKKVPLDVCLNGLRKRKQKVEQKIAMYETHMANGTLPPVIFGGRKAFYERMKQNISNQEWKDLRTRQLYSRGDKSKKGNLNMRITIDDNGQGWLEIANPLGLTLGKRTSPRIIVPITIPYRYYKEITDVVMGTQTGVNSKGKPMIDHQTYSVELLRKNDEFYVNITFEETEVGRRLDFKEIPISDVIAGIDVNPDRIAVSLCTKQGNFKESKIFYLHNLDTFSTDKRATVIGQMTQQIKDWLFSQHVGGIVLEDLHFQQSHDTDTYSNRKFHQFTYKKMVSSLIRMGLRHGFSVKTVNPAYTSVIGKLKYSKKYGISVHETAAFTIARRGLGLQEKLPKEMISLLQNQIATKLRILIASLDESNKNTKKLYKKWLQTIATWKDHHNWKLWSILHKTVYMSNQQILFQIKKGGNLV
ncbi:IS200/IS605 family accessory protein TnpB-related protein [Bacillus cereus group sp. BfR-BA-01380]|uniref:IS200/IS605 family accessory protein TnpB-related protein n=1 Tax=Bacillus cereus group sp. BfR-BA-01380 TaxID=2920324 RepID=UPI001F58C52E|nr:IS200/IS605 family accessory protein TnpB-related protein [Bacillus cereus group sp. BfR-BA-01380]